MCAVLKLIFVFVGVNRCSLDFLCFKNHLDLLFNCLQMMLITNESYSDMKDSLMKTVWGLYETHEMDVFMMMINDAYGTTFLGTGKLKQLMSQMSSLVGNRFQDNDFFNNVSAETLCNEFRFTEYEKNMEFIADTASSMITLTNSHVLVIVSNAGGRKFVFSTKHVKPYIAYISTSLASDLGEVSNSNELYESDSDVDK